MLRESCCCLLRFHTQGLVFLLAGAMGMGDFIKPPRVTVGNSERGQDNENSTDKDPGGEAELEVPGGSQLKSLES